MVFEQSGSFSIKSFYNHIVGQNSRIKQVFPTKMIWKASAPPRISFFAWEASKNRILTIDNLMKRGITLKNRRYLCKSNSKSCNICCFGVLSLLHYGSWSTVFLAFFGLQLVLSKMNYLLGK